MKGGGFVAGTFIRMKRKNAEVKAMYGRYGLPSGNALTWTVPAGALIPLTPEQVKLFNFP